MLSKMNPPIVSPEAIRKMQERMLEELNKIRDLGNKLSPPKESTGSNSQTVSTTTLSNKTGDPVNTKTENNTPEATTQQSTTNVNKTQGTTVRDKMTAQSVQTTKQNLKPANTTPITLIETSPTSPREQLDVTSSKITDSLNTSTLATTSKSTASIITGSPTSPAETVDAKTTDSNGPIKSHIDLNSIIFPPVGTDRSTIKSRINSFCSHSDFGDIKKGFQCCKRTLNCFDDLPENLDETVFHEGTHEYNEHERLHVCSHIDDAIRCKEALENRPVCRKAGPIMDQTIKPQMDKVKLFYYNHCNRGTPIGPSVLPPDPGTSQSNPPSGGKGSEHLHTQAGSYAPFIGGAIMGVFVLALIVLIAVYCRKRSKKNKRSKEQRCDPGRESSESSRYKAVTYNRRKSEIYAEIDEKSMVSCVSLALDGQSCSTDIVNLSQGSISSRKYPSAPSIRQVELDNHGYLSPQSIFSEDDSSKPDVIPNETNLTKDGYITLSESGDSAQSYAKLEAEPEDVYVHPDQIETSPNKLKKTEGQRNTYFILEKTDE